MTASAREQMYRPISDTPHGDFLASDSFDFPSDTVDSKYDFVRTFTYHSD